MPRVAGFEDVEFKNFTGLDLRGPTESLADRSLASLINMEVGDLGQLKTRPGFQLRNTSSPFNKPIKFIGHRSSNTQNAILIQTIEDNYNSGHGTGFVYASTDGGVTWTQISTPVGTQYACGKGAQYGDNSIDIPALTGKQAWNGSAWSSLAVGNNAIASSYDAVYLTDRYWTIEDSTGNVYFSELGNASDFRLVGGTKQNVIGFNLDNKDNIVGLCPYRDRMVVFFQNSIRIINCAGVPSTWTVKFIPFGVGVRSQNCYYVYNDLIYFLSSEGFYRTDLTQLEELSKPVQSLFSRRWEAYQQNTAIYNKYTDAIGFWRGRFIISMRYYGKSGGSFAPLYKMLMYNIRNGAWSEIVPNIPCLDSILPWTPATSFQSIFIGKRNPGGAQYNKEGLYTIFGDANGRVHLFDDEDPVYYDGSSNATTYACTVRTKDIDGGTPGEVKRSPTVGVRFKKSNTSNISAKYTVNEVARTPVNIASTTVPETSKIKGPGYFRKFNLELTDLSDQYLEIEGITVSAKKKQGLSETAT